MHADQIEIEVKFHLPNRSALRDRLIAQGAASQGETFETNRRYDYRRGSLLNRQCLLRLRQDQRARLTFKRPREEGQGEYKVYDEFEVIVEDFERMHQILGAIGLECVQMYEKRREVFRLSDALICIDQLPYGDFVEIEGPPYFVRDAVATEEIKVGDNDIIEDARFKTYGCGSAIASSSLLTEWVKGKTLEEASEIKNSEIADELALPPVKVHCSVLAEDAIKAAISDFKQKNTREEVA